MFRPFIERVSYLSGEPDRFYFALVGAGVGVGLEWGWSGWRWSGIGMRVRYSADSASVGSVEAYLRMKIQST